MIHSVVSSRSLLFAKLSFPLIVKPFSGGVLTSRTTVHALADGDKGACGRHLFV
jgi:hypothetical protein